MKVIKITVQFSTRYVGSRVEDELEVYVDDNATQQEIETAKEDAAREWVFNQVDWGWQDVE